MVATSTCSKVVTHRGDAVYDVHFDDGEECKTLNLAPDSAEVWRWPPPEDETPAERRRHVLLGLKELDRRDRATWGWRRSATRTPRSLIGSLTINLSISWVPCDMCMHMCRVSRKTRPAVCRVLISKQNKDDATTKLRDSGVS